MPIRSKKRRSNVRSHEPRSDMKQTLFTPQSRTVARIVKTPTPASISRKRQETLTQIGYVIYQNPEDLNLSYDNDDEDDATVDRDEIPHGRKRRRIQNEPEIPVTRQTRSAKRRAAENKLKHEASEHDGLILETNENQEAAQHSMPPPKTPQASGRKEVPSSQSPADTPLSTQSQRSARSFLASPLKERSKNIGIKTGSAGRRSARWAQKLEVPDNMCDDEEVQAAVQGAQPALAIPIKFEKTENDIHTPDVVALRDKGHMHHPRHSEKDVDGSMRKTPIVKSEVSDSEAENEDDGEGFSAGADTQAVFDALDMRLDSPFLTEESIPSRSSTWTLGLALDTSDAISFRERRYTGKEGSSESLDQELNGNKKPSQQARPIISRSSFLRSESEEVSRQLKNDLHSHTQTGTILEAELQFQSTSHEHEPALAFDDEDLDSSQPEETASSSHLSQGSINGEPRFPVLPSRTSFPSTNSTDPTSYAAPVSPSQAMTADTTRPPPAHPPSQQLLSSPPPPPPPFLFSSSPLPSRAAAESYAGVWDGVRLTDSQLLPDSLMNGTLVAPPALGEDGWEWEQETC